jgi:Family of unknown function (DUF6464)
MFGIILIILFIVSLFLSYIEERRERRRYVSAADAANHRRAYKRINRDPEEQYIEGVGYIIGDITCIYNARSPYIRCAVNPGGLCQDCRYYDSEEKGHN